MRRAAERPAAAAPSRPTLRAPCGPAGPPRPAVAEGGGEVRRREEGEEERKGGGRGRDKDQFLGLGKWAGRLVAHTPTMAY
uniref:Uncharacterized protein n=1 Tax=Oryza sativa subsp. japonica TaxID=39947 RepID=Q6Z6N6_ORYSJ|nr:hypothetical protein [Oryza sativa Japonica Group]BAD31002.1 hypothetical protein [Oryza sativa Japonica Group]